MAGILLVDFVDRFNSTSVLLNSSSEFTSRTVLCLVDVCMRPPEVDGSRCLTKSPYLVRDIFLDYLIACNELCLAFCIHFN